MSLLQEIQTRIPKKPQNVMRPRATGRVDNGKVEKLQDLLAPKIPAAVRAWVDGLKATMISYDRHAHKMVDTGFPDHRIRVECARAIVEYVVGKAIERSLEVSGNYKELSQVLEELKQSPEARRILPPEIWGMVPSAPEPSVEEKPVEPNSESGS